MATCSQPQLNQILYEQDFYLWIQTTAQLLKERRFEEVEWSNLIEEIESMGRSEKKELKSRLIVLIEHLLKLMYWESEKAYNARGWRNTVVEQRRQICLSLEDSPSLRSLLVDMFRDSYHIAREDTLQKYQLSSNLFPLDPPFTLEDVLNSDYLPQ
ncbi:MAG TPA: DUF29 domain-containing protein [Cyanobacteria bacterium UBA11149]|nr:DUF29 domain-containing protein [Cyanobacteria bacterium UBA11366]HBR72609.1 DUF29 domain-containing protein [Cyanobacteria bacterium UBA11159]HBS71180.1 DUF29 domain-containing protein [Cyanobacteria bacterium UBA11153]HBW92334.1 DUF29 domain-containing protein [Cyanobacteria bacterium UBA11149]HCA96380.1 DUF29 domain-containing protein [Cyanobacteria bacterium UBA9226]